MNSSDEDLPVAGLNECGKLGIKYLKRYWSKMMLKVERRVSQDAFADEWNLDNTLLSVIGAGIYQITGFFYERRPSFSQFEDWILSLGEPLNSRNISLFNDLVSGKPILSDQEVSDYELSAHELDFWNENGYLIVKQAVPRVDCEAAVHVIADFLGIDLNEPESWYRGSSAIQGIMVDLHQHPVLQKNREAPKIRAAYEQLWGKRNLWLSMDKVGFNPPETEFYKYRGIGLHWDVSLELPIPFGLQGILYLTDTAANQGAFSCVPGFHNKITEWLNALPENIDPRELDLSVLGPYPVAASAGDCIIWHHSLPHGASPNRHSHPRFVQYLNYRPIDFVFKPGWK